MSQDLPDFQLPEEGKPLGALSVRVREEADLVQLLTTLRDAGAEVVAINTFPATRGEPDVVRVYDFEIRNFEPAAAAALLAGLPGVAKVEPRNTLGQIFGKRVIVIGGGAQVAQVTLGAVSASNGSALQYSATVILGSGLLYYAMRQVFLHSRGAARQLLKATIVYLPLQFLIFVLGKS